MRASADTIRRAGRLGDTELVHMNRRELGHLAELWGEPSTNPVTGLPEFFDFGGIASWLAPAVVPALVEAIGGSGTLGGIGDFLGAGADWGPTLGSAGLGAITGGLAQGLQGKDALMGAVGGGLIGGVVPTAANALGFTGMQAPFNVPTLFDLGSAVGAAGTPGTGGFDPTKAVGPGNMPMDNVPTDSGGFGSGASAAGGAASGASDKGGWLSRNPWAPLLALGALGAMGSPSGSQTSPPTSPQQGRTSTYTFPTTRLQRGRNTKAPGKPGEYVFFDDNQTPDVPTTYAEGGPTADSGGDAQGYIQGPGDGREDAIPARLSNDEYVLDAETLALLGNGSPSAGADKMDQFRVNLRRHKGAALAKGKFSPAAKPVEGYLS